MPYAGTLGWDTAKLNDPTHTTPKYQFMRAVQDAGLNPIDATNNPQSVIDAINKQQPGVASLAPNGRINWGSLGPVDYSIDSGKGGWFFNPENERAAAPTGTPPPPSAGTQAPVPESGTQSELVRQAILQLGTNRPETPQPLDATANPSDQLLGNYDDLVRQQILGQMQA